MGFHFAAIKSQIEGEPNNELFDISGAVFCSHHLVPFQLCSLFCFRSPMLFVSQKKFDVFPPELARQQIIWALPGQEGWPAWYGASQIVWERATNTKICSFFWSKIPLKSLLEFWQENYNPSAQVSPRINDRAHQTASRAKLFPVFCSILRWHLSKNKLFCPALDALHFRKNYDVHTSSGFPRLQKRERTDIQIQQSEVEFVHSFCSLMINISNTFPTPFCYPFLHKVAPSDDLSLLQAANYFFPCHNWNIGPTKDVLRMLFKPWLQTTLQTTPGLRA